MEKDITNTSILLANTEDLSNKSYVNEKPSNKFGISLTDQEKASRQTGYTQSTLGVNRSSWNDVQLIQKQRAFDPDYTIDSKVTTPFSSTQKTSDGSTTLEKEDDTFHVGTLHNELYGSTAYADLKHKVGIAVDDSFTEYYNRTKHIPAGYEMEAKLLLAEEKRMNLYNKHLAGEISETDFLYQAYGKDLLKQSGYDFESTLYWYNRHKNGDYSNPLDNDTFLEELISNSRSLWQNEQWFQDSNEKTLSSSLAGVVTGQSLSAEKVRELFKDQFDALDEHFNNDINKIITYYQAGSLGMNVFNPFLDTDGDGKYDYYYHTDGKMYAVKGSSGSGPAECEVKYTKDAAGNQVVESVDITEGFPDWLEGLGTGLRNFVMGFVDIGYLAANAVGSIFGEGSYGDNFVANQQEFEAWKARNYLGGQTEVNINGSEWTAYNISSAVGEIAGTILMTVATAGIGGVATGVKASGTTAAKVALSGVDDAARIAVNSIDDVVRLGVNSVDDLAKVGVKSITGLKELGVNSIDDLARVGVKSSDDLLKMGIKNVDDLTNAGIKVGARNSMDDIGKALADAAKDLPSSSSKLLATNLTDEIAGLKGKDVIKMLQQSGMDDASIKEFLKNRTLKTSTGIYKLTRGQGAKNAIKYGAGQATGKVLDISKGIMGTLSRAKTGQGFGASMWSQALSSSAILAVQDFASTYSNLSAANKSLSYLSTIDPDIEMLSDEEIFFRAGATAATDLVISTLFRLSGSDGLTTKVKALTGNNAAAKTAGNIMAGLNPAAQSSISNLSKHLVRNAVIDNVADAAENIITAAVSIAANNAYGDFNLQEILKGAGSYLTSPSGAMMTTYITAKNFVSSPRGSKVGDMLWGQSTLDQRQELILSSYVDAAKRMDNYMHSLSQEAASLRASREEELIIKAEAIENLVNKYYSTVNDPAVNKMAATINFIQEFDTQVFGQNPSDENIAKLLGFKSITDANNNEIKSVKNQVDEIKGILKTFGNTHKDMGVFAAYVLNNAKAKNVAETFEEYATTLNNTHKLNKSTTDVYTKILKGTYNADMLLEGSWLAKHNITKFQKALDDIGEKMGFNQKVTLANITKQFFEKRTLPVNFNSKEFETVFDSAFDMEIFSREALLSSVDFKMKDGYLTVDKRYKKNKEGLVKFEESNNPILQMFTHPEVNKEAIKKLLDLGYFVYDEATQSIKINNASQTPILGVMVMKPEMMNTIKDKNSKEGKLYAMYEAIAELGEAKDPNGIPVADWETPLVTKLEIKNPSKENGSGNDTTYRVFVIGNKLDASLAQFYNKPKMLNTMISSLHLLNESSDIDSLRKAALNFTLALSEINETDLSNLSVEEQEILFKKYLPQFASAILTMSDAKATSNNAPALFNRQRLIYLYINGVLTDEVLDSFATGKANLGISDKARNEAVFLKDYIKTRNDVVVELNKVFHSMKTAMENGVKVPLTSQDYKKMTKLINELKKPGNEELIEALKEDKVINENLDKLINDTGNLLPFLQELEVKGQSLVDLTSAGISLINSKDEAALKQMIVDFLDGTTLETFTESYNDLYLEARYNLYNELKEVRDSNSKKYLAIKDDAQAIKAEIDRLNAEATALNEEIIKVKQEFKAEENEIKRIEAEELAPILNELRLLAEENKEAYEQNQHTKSILDSEKDIRDNLQKIATEKFKAIEKLRAKREEVENKIKKRVKQKYKRQAEILAKYIKYAEDYNSLDYVGKLEAEWYHKNNKNNFKGMLKDAELKSFKDSREDIKKNIRSLFKEVNPIVGALKVIRQDIKDIRDNSLVGYNDTTSLKEAIANIEITAEEKLANLQESKNKAVDNLREEQRVVLQNKKAGQEFLAATNAEKNEAFKNVQYYKELKALLYSLDDFETKAFFKDPEGYLMLLETELIDNEVFTKAELQEFTKEALTFINSEERMNQEFNKINDSLREDTLRNYLRVALGKTNDLLSGDIYKDSSGYWRYKEGNDDYSIAEKLLESDVTTAELVKAFDVNDAAEKVKDIILNYNKYLSEGTVLKQADDVLEINILDFIPQEYNKLLTLYQSSMDAKANHSLQIQEDALKREMSGILNGSTLNYQTKHYLDLVRQANASGSFIVRIPLSDKESLNKWKDTFTRLGYGNDFIKVMANEAISVPGVTVKNGTISALETGVSFDVFRKILSDDLTKLESHSSTGLVPKDNKSKLINMFNSMTYVTEDTKIDLNSDQIFYGIPKTGKITIDTAGVDVLERSVKMGLVGGEFAKVFTILNRAMVQTEEVNPKATNSFNVLRLFNMAAEYSEKEFRHTTHKITMSDSEHTKAVEFYNNNPNSLFKVAGREGGKTIFVMNESFINNKDALLNSYKDKFDIKTLIPLWGEWDVNNSYAEYETIFTLAQNLGYSIDELKTLSKTPLEILDISITARDASVGAAYTGNKTIKEFSDSISWDTDNYYLLTKKAHLESALAFSKEFINSISEDPRMESILKFANRKSLVVLGNLLNKAEYDGINVNDEVAMGKLLTAFKEGYSKELVPLAKPSGPDFYSENITSADIGRISTGTSTGEVTLEDLKNIIELTRSHTGLLVDTQQTNGLPKHNKAWAILSCLDSDGKQAYISMEYFEKLSFKDREYLIKTIESAINNETYNSAVSKALTKLHSTLIDKNNKLSSHELSGSMPTAIKFDIEYANSPTVELTKTMFGGLGEKSTQALATILANRSYTKLPAKRYVSSSSMQSESTFNPVMDSYMKLINGTLYRTVDKQGHTMVYNMNSKEAIGEFFGSIAGFKKLLKKSDMFKDIDDDILYELAMKANTYSTGTTIDAEYSGALILTIKGKDANGKPIYDITPVSVSGIDSSKGILDHLVFNPETGLHGATTEKKLMITVGKNAFIKTPSGINSDIKAFDLNDDDTKQSLLQHAYYKALDDRKRRGTYSETDTPEQILLDYYQPKTLTTTESYELFVNTMKEQGVESSIAEALLPSIQKLHVANETSFSEEQLNETLVKYVNDPSIPNEEVSTIRDVLLFKVTHSALPEDMKLELTNTIYKFVDDIRSGDKRELVKNVNLLLDDNLPDKTNVYKNLSKLSQEDKETAFKLYILQRRSGQDLNFLMNRVNLFDYSNVIKSKVNAKRNEYLDWYKNYDVVTYDTEWLIPSNKFKDNPRGPLYQIGFTVTKPVQDYNDPDSLNKTSYTILVLDGFEKNSGMLNSAADDGKDPNKLFYTEDTKTFVKKMDDAIRIGAGKSEGNIYVVDTVDQAIAKFKELTQGYTHFAGYNNKAEGSDNSWFGDYFETDGRQVMDIRSDVNHKVLSSVTENLSGDSLDYYGTKGIITRDAAHDANSDVIDSIKLLMKIATSTVDTEGAYNTLARDAIDFCNKVGITDTDEFLKKISFTGVFPESMSKHFDLFKTMNIHDSKYVIGNEALKQSTSAYNSMLSKRYRRIRTKELNRLLDSYIQGRTTSETRSRFIDSVQDNQHRDTVLKIITKLFDARNVDLKTHTNADTEYKENVMKIMERAIRTFQKETEAATGKHMSRADAAEEFLSSDMITITNYLKGANKYPDENGVVTFFTDPNVLKDCLNPAAIEAADTTALKEAWVNKGLTNVERESPNLTSDKYSFYYFMEPVTKLLGFEEGNFKLDNTLGLDEDTAKLLLNNLIHVYGAKDENFDKLNDKTFIKSANKLNLFSNQSKQAYEEAVDRIFGKEFSQIQALYAMGNERPEDHIIADGSSLDGYKAETGVVYISERLIKKAYPDLNYKVGDEFYTQVWRQPGQQKTVMHVMKVKVVEKGSLSMTRTTAKSYFNGDFDGDFYYFARPNESAQKFGAILDKYTRAHTSLLDNLFKGVTVQEGELDTTLRTIELATLQILRRNSDMMQDIINDPNPSKLDALKKTFITELTKRKLTQKRAEELWDTFGFKVVNMSEISNENINALITNNPYIKNSKFIKNNKELYYKLLNNSADYLHANQYADDRDSQTVGGIAKRLKESKATGKAAETLYTSRITLTGETTERIREALQTEGIKLYNNLIESIDNLKTNNILSDEDVVELKSILGTDSEYSTITEEKATELSTRILNVFSLTQDLVIQNKDYNDSINTFLKGEVANTTSKEYLDDVNKLKLLIDSANEMLSTKITLTDADTSSRPMMLKKAAEVMHAMTTEKQRYYNRYFALSSSTLNNLFKDSVLKGNTEIETVDKLEIISNKEKVSFNPDAKSIGTKKIKVAVLKSPSATDTAFITKNNRDTVNTYLSIPNVKNLNNKQKDALFNLYKEGAEISGSNLNSFLGTNYFTDEVKYTFRGAQASSGKPATKFEDVDQILVSSSVGLSGASDSFKIGMTTGKDFKVTLGQSDIDFGEGSDIGYVMTENMIKHKYGPNTILKQVGTQKDTKGVEYAVYEISNMAIVDTSYDKKVSNSVRNIDTISIMQGSQGLEAAISFGKWFLTVGDDEITYDPEGYQMLREAIGGKDNPMGEETNGMAELNFIRIASIINSLCEESLSKFATDIRLAGKTKKEILAELYQAGDLGGDHGFDILDKLENILSVNSADKTRFIELRDSNPLLTRAWGTDLEAKIEGNYRQTSQDFFTEEGNKVKEAYKSKREMPRHNARYSHAQNDMNIRNRLIAYEGSAIDYNTAYVGKFDLLNTLMPDSHFSKSKLDNLYNEGLIDFVKGRKGNLYNGFKFIEEGQGKFIDASEYPSVLPDKKVGTTTPEAHIKNLTTGTVTGLVGESLGKRGRMINEEALKLTKQMHDSTLTPALQTRIAMMMGDGSRESMYNAIFPNNVTVGYSSSRPYLGISDNTIALKTASVANANQNLMTVKGSKDNLGVRDQIIEDTKTPMAAIEVEKIRKSKESMLANTKTAFEAINKDFKNNNYDEKFKNFIKAYNDDNKGKLNSDDNFWKSLRTDLLKTEEETVSKLIKVYSNSNDVELVNSLLRSWGFKAKGNKDISLGNKVISLQNYVEGYKGQYLGKEFDIIASMLKDNKDLNYSFNYYMEISRHVDMYKELANNSTKWEKAFSKKKYAKYLAQAETQVLNGFKSIEEAEAKLNSLLSNSLTLQTLVSAANKINTRIQEEARKINPYTILGYSVPVYSKDSKVKNDSWFKSMLTRNNTSYISKESSLLSGGDGKQNGDINNMIHLYDADCDGWTAMVQRISTDIAVENSMRTLKQTLVNEGWMRNSELMFAANNYLINNFKDLADIIVAKSPRDIDVETYNILRASLNEAGIPSEKYRNGASFMALYERATAAVTDMYDIMSDMYGKKINSLQDLYELIDENRDTPNYTDLMDNLRLANAHQQIMATMCSMISESREGKDFLVDLYRHCERLVSSGEYTLVDDRGASLNSKFAIYKTSDVEGYTRYLQYGREDMPLEERQAAIGKMMLSGEVYLMKKSVAEQLQDKVFTKRIDGKVARLLRKTSQLVTSFIMSTPIKLVDRILNYTIYDIGVLGSANASCLKYVPQSTATIRRYMSSIDSITEYDLNNDKNLQYLIRYIAASGQSPLSSNVFRGESIDPSSLPVIKGYLKKVNSAFNQQNLVARFAYFLDLVHSAETNGKIDAKKAGVAYHMMDEIYKIKGDANASDAYENTGKYLSDIDAQASQIIAENLGAVGNNPYGASVLGRMGFMFTTFPLIGARWAKNRVQSLAYAFTHLDDGTSGMYLGRNLGSLVLTNAVLLALQILMSGDSQEYLFGDEEEMTEEEIENAKNIIFRGGCVKLFESALQGQETTTSSHNRGTEYALYDSFLKNLVELEEGENIGDGLGNLFKTQVWSHLPALIKDPIESIPGNTALQSTTWATPSDSFLDNYVRKISGYLMGSAQANAFINSLEATEYESDMSTYDRLSLGLQKAYTDSSSNIKEYKAAYKNYKKAFSIIYEYQALVNQDKWSLHEAQNSSSLYSDFTSELNNALKNKSSSSAVYELIAKYKKEGMALSTMISALKNSSLKAKILKLEDFDGFMSYLSDSERAIIKSALAYEDYNYPYFDDIIEELTQEYKRLNKSNYRPYITIPKSRTYYTQTDRYGYNKYGNTNYKNYNKVSNYYNYLKKNNSNKWRDSPMDAYNDSMNSWKYGKATDIWGNKQTGYTNIKGDTWTWDGGK